MLHREAYDLRSTTANRQRMDPPDYCHSCGSVLGGFRIVLCRTRDLSRPTVRLVGLMPSQPKPGRRGLTAPSTTKSRALLKLLAVLGILISLNVNAQTTKHLSYEVGPKPLVSITNNYGSIAVQSSESTQVIVTTVAYSDAISFLTEQRGNRVELRAESKSRGTGLADYKVLVPKDTIISLRSSDGRLHAQGLNGGDIILEAENATVEVSDARDAHIHVKTLSGPVTLSDIRDSHLDIYSVGGSLTLNNVTDSFVEAHSASGQIIYDGDPGKIGDYTLTTHTGNLDASIPATASVQITSRSLRGTTDQDVSNPKAGPSTPQENRFLPLRSLATSRFVLRSFKGHIRIRRP